MLTGTQESCQGFPKGKAGKADINAYAQPLSPWAVWGVRGPYGRSSAALCILSRRRESMIFPKYKRLTTEVVRSICWLPIVHGRPSIVIPSASVRWTLAGIKKRARISPDSQMFALPIFPGSRPPSIVGVHELNFCVRDGNRWTLMTINTNYLIYIQALAS